METSRNVGSDAEEAKDNFKVFVDDDGILNLVFLKNSKAGLASSQILTAQLIARQIKEILRQNPDKCYNVFIDVARLGNLLALASEARKIYAELVALPQTKKVASFGKQIFYKIVMSFISRLAGKELKWFTDKEKAMEWLKSN